MTRFAEIRLNMLFWYLSAHLIRSRADNQQVWDGILFPFNTGQAPTQLDISKRLQSEKALIKHMVGALHAELQKAF